MRIIAGTKRGMNLFSPKGLVSRPITDRVKESLFSVLFKYDLPRGKVVADLFSGVGSLGLEALSRGAEFVTFVEQDGDIIATLKRNIDKAGFAKQSRIVRTDAFRTGAPVDPVRGQYDLVFVDPPYITSRQTQASSSLCELLKRLGEQVKTGGYVIVRTEENVMLAASYDRLDSIERRQWGTMAVTILRRRANETSE